MEEDLKKAYQKRLLAHYHNPKGVEPAPMEASRGWARNRTCGDEVSLWVKLHEDSIEGVWQETKGCAIATATASLLVQNLPNQTKKEALILLDRIDSMVMEGDENLVGGDWELLNAVHPLTSRHECVRVALNACRQALHAAEGPKDVY